MPNGKTPAHWYVFLCARLGDCSVAKRNRSKQQPAAAVTTATQALHASAYAYYSAAHTTSGDGRLSNGTKRLLSAALLSSTSLLAIGTLGTSSAHAQAAPACNTVGTTVTCSGNAGDATQLLFANDLNVTADNTFVQDTSGRAGTGTYSNAGIRLTMGSRGTVTNNGQITTGQDGTNFASQHGIITNTTETAKAYNTGTISVIGSGPVMGTRTAGVAAVSTGGIATSINQAGGTVNVNGAYANGISANGDTATARNYGTVQGAVTNPVGVYALATGTATASNAGTINMTGDGPGIGVGASGATVNVTNTGSVTTSGANVAGLFGRSVTARTTNITNSGTVTAASGTGSGIYGVGPTVNITNTASGTVTGGGVGVVAVAQNTLVGMAYTGGTATVTNAGTINGGVTSYNPGGRPAMIATPNTFIVNNNGGTINGSIRSNVNSIANITNNGGTVGDNTTAIATGSSNGDQVTITGTGNVINGTIEDGNTFGGYSSGNILTFSQTDTVRLTQGRATAYGGGGFISVQAFDEVRFTAGTTEFVGSNTFLSTNNRAPYSVETAVTVGPGATFKVSGGTTTFGRADEGIVFGGTLNATGAGTQRATVEVPAGGRLNFTGDVTFGDKGRFKVGIAGQNNAGYLQGNNVTFNAGSEIYADLTRGIELTDGQGIKVANATNTLTDNGAAVYDNSALVNFTKSVVGNDLFLIPQRGVRAVPATGTNRGSSNALNIAAAIDAFIDTAPTDNPIVQFLAQFPVAEQEQRLAQLVQDTLPEESGATGSASVVSTDMVIDLIMERLSGGGFNVVDSGQGNGQTGVAAGDMFLGTDANLALWGRVGGSFAEFTPSGVNGFDSNTYAVSIGIDGDITPEIRFGLAGFYSDTDVDENGSNPNSGQQIEGLGVLAYASWRPEDWYVNGTVGYGHNQYKSQRTAAGAVHTASFNGTQLMSRVEAGRIFQFDEGALDITPHVGLRANKLWLDGYTEGGPVATTVNSQNITSVRAVAGVGARYTFEYDNGSRFLPEGYIRGLQELADPSQPITGSVVGGGQFVSTPTERDDFSYAVGAGFTYEFTDVFSVRLLYDGEFQDDYREDSVTAAIRVEF